MGGPGFPNRQSQTVAYGLSAQEQSLYDSVTA